MFEELLEEVRAEYGVPAVDAAFVRGGEITAAAVGVQKIDQQAMVTVRNHFHIGSVSKPITATVIATLVEAVLLSWDTTVMEVFADLADQIDPSYRPVTLENLLSHRAEIMPWEEDEEIASAPTFQGTPKHLTNCIVPSEITVWVGMSGNQGIFILAALEHFWR